MLDCNHNPTLITGSRGSNGTSRVTVCTNCGQFDVYAEKDGVHFNKSFSLYGSYELLAASQAHRLMTMPDTKDEDVARKRIWRPLDFAQQRLYFVIRSWDIKEGDKPARNYKDQHVVFADSPSHAAALVEATYEEQYKNDERIVFHHSQGFPLNVLQPLSWTVNGIRLIDAEVRDGDWVPGEFSCPKCQFRLSKRLLSAQDGSVGVDQDAEPPDCMNTCGVKMTRVSWRDAAEEAGRIATRWMNWAKLLEEAWPADFPMPVDSALEPMSGDVL